MLTLARTDTSIVGRWWWTVDRWTLAAIFALVGMGVLLVVTASPPVASRIGADPFHFVRRHLTVLPVGIALLIGVSLLSPRNILRLSVGVFVLSLALLALTFISGVEIKGARRWINVAGLQLQPSEFVKPAFAVITGWLLAEGMRKPAFPGRLLALAAYGIIVSMVVLQPDLGMTVIISAVLIAQLFLAGLPLWLVGGLLIAAVGGVLTAYFTLPHVTSRIDRFLDPSTGDSYQVDKSISAFMNGGLFGRGPAVGSIKEQIPDAHADFVFAVAGEELGVLVCLLIVALFAFVVLRGFSRLLNERSLFVLIAAAGLLTNVGLQAVVNIGSSLHLLPTKGMTLPFISYGGSSLLALSLTMGMVLALNRRRVDAGGLT